MSTLLPQYFTRFQNHVPHFHDLNHLWSRHNKDDENYENKKLSLKKKKKTNTHFFLVPHEPKRSCSFILLSIHKYAVEHHRNNLGIYRVVKLSVLHYNVKLSKCDHQFGHYKVIIVSGKKHQWILNNGWKFDEKQVISSIFQQDTY